MPRILSARRNSYRKRSNTSLTGSKLSLKGAGSSRRASLQKNSFGSQFDLRRLSLDDGAPALTTASSQVSQHQGLNRHEQQEADPSSKQNAVWNFISQSGGSVSRPPSLVPSESSIQTSDRSSSQSSESSIQPPSTKTANALRQYYSLRRASLTLHHLNKTREGTTPAVLAGSLPVHASRRGSLQHTPTNALTTPGSPSCFLRRAYSVPEDTWGQFVDTADSVVPRSSIRPVISSHTLAPRIRRC